VIRRRLFAVASTISLLLCLATVGLWTRSSFVEDQIARIHRIYVDHKTANQFETAIISTNGSVGLSRGRGLFQPDRATADAEWPEAVVWSHESRSAIKFRDAYGINSFGFGAGDFGGSGPISEKYQFVPIAPVSALLGVLPFCWFVRWQRHRTRIARNLCAICSYSLTGNTSGVCPECGTPIAGKAEVKA
jgi:hypothetical protein